MNARLVFKTGLQKRNSPADRHSDNGKGLSHPKLPLNSWAFVAKLFRISVQEEW
jgi:hypothetical protein